uniref:Uncharacterized protein n=1 Tax=Dulem virus 165 TaxID=3145642 RepID=A0AAU8B4M2_9VIRU
MLYKLDNKLINNNVYSPMLNKYLIRYRCKGFKRSRNKDLLISGESDVGNVLLHLDCFMPGVRLADLDFLEIRLSGSLGEPDSAQQKLFDDKAMVI